MRITYDPSKRATTLTQRGLDFEDAEIVFRGVTVEIETHERTTVRSESSVSANLAGEWL